jgi:hypothetical protein
MFTSVQFVVELSVVEFGGGGSRNHLRHRFQVNAFKNGIHWDFVWSGILLFGSGAGLFWYIIGIKNRFCLHCGGEIKLSVMKAHLHCLLACPALSEFI